MLIVAYHYKLARLWFGLLVQSHPDLEQLTGISAVTSVCPRVVSRFVTVTRSIFTFIRLSFS